MQKICSKCKQNLNISEFAKRGKSFQSVCRKCHSLKMKEHYNNNKTYYIEKASRNNKNYKLLAIKLIIQEFSRGCIDCGNKDIRVLEFDHLKDKSENISSLLGKSASIDKIKKEIAKCEVVCANCHNIRTSIRANDWRARYVSVA